jgi:hypothetical protein
MKTHLHLIERKLIRRRALAVEATRVRKDPRARADRQDVLRSRDLSFQEAHQVAWDPLDGCAITYPPRPNPKSHNN